MKTLISAERVIDASAEVVYRCLADYRQHHRPGGFLPPAFSDFEVLRGGVGAGTEIRYTFTAGGRRQVITASIAEPSPGRTLVETSPGVVTTSTIERLGDGRSHVRFDTVLDARGIGGIGNRLFAGRLLRPVYEDELERLDAYARTLAATDAQPA